MTPPRIGYRTDAHYNSVNIYRRDDVLTYRTVSQIPDGAKFLGPVIAESESTVDVFVFGSLTECRPLGWAVVNE